MKRNTKKSKMTRVKLWTNDWIEVAGGSEGEISFLRSVLDKNRIPYHVSGGFHFAVAWPHSMALEVQRKDVKRVEKIIKKINLKDNP